MATYTKETALFDTGAIGDAINDTQRQINIGLYGEDGNGGVVAELSLKLDKVEGATGTDLISSINAVADQINLSADNINFGDTNVQEELNKYNANVSIDASSSSPSVRVGQADNFHVSVTPEKLSFYEDAGTEVAYISNEKLHINAAELQTVDGKAPSFRMGKFIWMVRTVTNADDRLTLRYAPEDTE